MGEQLLKDYEKAYGLKYCILRYFNAAGASKTKQIGEAHNPEHHIIPLIFPFFGLRGNLSKVVYIVENMYVVTVLRGEAHQ